MKTNKRKLDEIDKVIIFLKGMAVAGCCSFLYLGIYFLINF